MLPLISILLNSSDMGVWMLLVFCVACLKVCFISSSALLNFALKVLAFFFFFPLVAYGAFNFPPPLLPVTNLLYSYCSFKLH